jgi:hypothetical protein
MVSKTPIFVSEASEKKVVLFNHFFLKNRKVAKSFLTTKKWFFKVVM